MMIPAVFIFENHAGSYTPFVSISSNQGRDSGQQLALSVEHASVAGCVIHNIISQKLNADS